jgi:HAD superfamily hydrolase (TIGR01490 family)
VDGTLTDTNIVTPLVWMKQRALRAPWNTLWLASLAVRGPWWWTLDQFSRSASNRAIYSNYRGVAVELLHELGESYYRERIRPRLFSGAQQRLADWRREGIRIVLVTGGLDVFMEPMAREFAADCIAPGLEVRDGSYTGRLKTVPLTGAEKARRLREHAAAHNVDLSKSQALGDAIGDLPMLECVGRPVAVNPDSRLSKIAIARSWQVEMWR